KPHHCLHSFPTRRSSDLRQFFFSTAEKRTYEKPRKLGAKNWRHVPESALGRSILGSDGGELDCGGCGRKGNTKTDELAPQPIARSEEHTSELQSRGHLVC